MKISKIISVLSAAVITAGITAVPASAELNPFTNEYFSVEQKEEYGFSFSGAILTKTDENGTYCFTGRVKVNGKSKFYDNGVLWTGWRKINGKWYYFDPDNNGIMAEEKVKTALGYYYFDENGAWTGRLTKSAVYPEDFDFMMSDYVGADWTGYEINTFDNKITVLGVYNDDDSRSISLSKRDKQIFYDVIMNCNLTEIKDKLYASYLYKINADSFAEDESVVAGILDANEYITKFVADGKSYEIQGGYEMYLYYPYENSGEVRDFAYFLAVAKSYIWDTPQYAEIEAANKAAADKAVNGENN